MFQRLKSFAAPPVFDDEDKTRTAGLLNMILLSALGTIGVYGAVMLLTSPYDSSTFIFLIFFGATDFGLLMATRRGHVRRASAGVVLSALVGLLLAMVAFGGVRGASYTSLIVVVIMAGILMGARAAAVIAALSIIAGGVMVAAEFTGRYAPAPDFLTAQSSWTGEAPVFVLAAVLLGLADRAMRRALAQARGELAERRQAEARLRESEERYRLISATMSDYTFYTRVEPGGKAENVWMAGAFETITGYTPEEFAALGGWRATLHPDDIAQDKRDMAALFANQKVVTELRIIKKGGEVRWVRVYGHPVWEAEHNRLAGIYGGVQDITERRQADEALRRYARRTEILHEIDRALLSAESPEAIAPATTDSVRRLVGCQRVSIALFDFQLETATLLAVSTETPSAIPPGAVLSFDDYSRPAIEAHRRGEVFAIDNVLAQDRMAASDRRLLEAEGVQAWLSAPLLYHGNLIGALNLGAGEPRAFTDEEVQIAREVANQLAITFQQSRLLAETTEALAREQRLNEVASIISSSLELPDTLARVVRLAAELVGAECGAMGLVSADGESLLHPYLYNLPDNLALEESIPRGYGVAWRVIESGQSVMLADYAAHPAALPHWVAAGVRGFIEAPIVAGQQQLGILGLYQRHSAKRFGERELALAEAIGRQAGVAIQNARLFEAERQRANEQEALRATLTDLSTELEPARLLQSILERAVRLAATDMGELGIFDEAAQELVIVASHNFEKDYAGTRMALGEGTMGLVAQTREPLIIDDYQRWDGRSPQYAGSTIHACIVLPLVFGERLLGAFGMAYTYPARRFSPADLRLFSLFAAQAAIAIHNAQLYDAERRRVALLTALHETGLGLNAQLDLPGLLRTIVERAVRLLDARMGELYLVTPDGASLELVVNHNLLPDYVVTHLHMGEGVSGAVAASGQPIIVPDYKDWSTRVPHFAAGPYRAMLSVPILWQDKAVGVINVVDEKPGSFTARDLDPVRQLAAQAAVAIQNARLFEAERRQVKELALLHTIALAGAEAANEDDVIEQATGIISEAFYQDHCGVLLVDQQAGVLRVHPSHRGIDEALQKTLIPLGQGITGAVAVRGQPWRQADVRQEPAYILTTPDMRSELCVPLKTEDRIIGVINVESRALNAFSESDERLMMTIAGQLAPAIQRLRAEAALRALNSELEQRVGDRTAQLEAANQELESFSYSISHDLRAPLRSINGFARILLERSGASLDSDAQRYFQRIREGAQRMGDLIDDLLAFSRLSRLPLHKQTVDFAPIIQHVVEELQIEYAHHEIEITLGRLPPAKADPALLRQVFTNLLSNAFKYSAPRRPARIEVGQTRNEQHEIIYFVRDNGVGFDMRYADKLFGVFQRLHREEEFEGTGVGLATVHRIIQRHGGRIWPEAEVGQGATFYFTLGPES